MVDVDAVVAVPASADSPRSPKAVGEVCQTASQPTGIGRTWTASRPACVAMLSEARATAEALSAVALRTAEAVPQPEGWFDAAVPYADIVMIVPVASAPPLQQRRGRARVRAAGKKKKSTAEPSGSAAAALHGMLESKAETRRSKVVRSLGAAGAANLAAAPSRAELGEGAVGDDAFEQVMNEFVDENMHARAVQKSRGQRSNEDACPGAHTRRIQIERGN